MIKKKCYFQQLYSDNSQTTRLTHFSVEFSDFQYIHIIVQPSVQLILEQFHHPAPKETLCPLAIISHCPCLNSRDPGIYSLCKFVYSGHLHKWNCTIRGLLRLSSFTQHHVFKVHPCCSMHHRYSIFFLHIGNAVSLTAVTMPYSNYIPRTYLYYNWKVMPFDHLCLPTASHRWLGQSSLGRAP